MKEELESKAGKLLKEFFEFNNIDEGLRRKFIMTWVYGYGEGLRESVDTACNTYANRHIFLDNDAKNREVALFREALEKALHLK